MTSQKVNLIAFKIYLLVHVLKPGPIPSMSVAFSRPVPFTKAKSMPAFSEEIIVMSIMLPPLCHSLSLEDGREAGERSTIL